MQQFAREQVGELLVVELHITTLPERMNNKQNIQLTDVDFALKQADIVVGLVGHNEFKQIDQDLLQEKIVIDLCGMWR